MDSPVFVLNLTLSPRELCLWCSLVFLCQLPQIFCLADDLIEIVYYNPPEVFVL
jgi:hypothetical protein